MAKKIVAIALIMVILTSFAYVFNQNNATALTAAPSALKIYIGPTSVLADNNVYNCIFIQLQDGSGKPARATEDTTITLTSQTTSVGTVDPSVTIPKNQTYASANFTSTLVSGNTIITASATGYSTVQASITTVTPIPSSIAIFGFPSTLPADGGTYPAILVQLQDSSGRPQRAPPGGVDVRLSCSQLSVGSVSPEIVTIPYGSTYTIANFTTTNTPSTTPATITTQANGYTSKTVQITTKSVTTTPKNLVLFVGPTQILADNGSYPQVAVELQDQSGNIAAATSNITVTLSSSDIAIGQVNDSLIIGPESPFPTYGIATFNSTFKAGSTIIYALATNLNGAQKTITTIEYIPPKLAVFIVPPIEPSDNSVYPAIELQLQDSSGRPAKNLEGDVTVNLFSQHPEVASINPTLTIPSGKTQATANITVTNSPGSTTISATASGYSTGQAQITTYLIDYTMLQVELTANPQSIGNAKTSNLTAYVTGDGAPITGATITFAADNGGTFTTLHEQGNGYYTATFTAPNFAQTTTCTITATASKTNYLSGQNTVAITVVPSSTPTSAPTPTSNPTATPNPSSTPTASSAASLQLFIKDANGNPLNGTIVQSIVQPVGAKQLFDVTNESGYVTFRNVTAGLYTFKIVRQGYEPLNATLTLTGQPLTLPLTLLSENGQSGDNSQLVLIAIIIVIIAVVASLSSVYVIRRRGNAKVRKLKELQNQLKPKSY